MSSKRVKQKIPGLVRTMKVGQGFRITLAPDRVIEVVYYKYRSGSQISMVANCPKDIVIDLVTYDIEDDPEHQWRPKQWRT